MNRRLKGRRESHWLLGCLAPSVGDHTVPPERRQGGRDQGRMEREGKEGGREGGREGGEGRKENGKRRKIGLERIIDSKPGCNWGRRDRGKEGQRKGGREESREGRGMEGWRDRGRERGREDSWYY